ncbi:Lrp/AsnC family transcriptional regulator [Nocardioides sp. BYT-33-1]|uniref:Lrp/AsnC family transcriptional regulator n=1 Tax=Nocardioides sp. BYT-33-1 TaxID=3416952 RepID=UPI003F538AD8
MVSDSNQAHLDQIDLAILDLLREDARRTVTDIAARVNLSLAPVKRRIDRLERSGIIRGYTVLLDPRATRPRVEAHVEVKLVADDPEDFVAWLRGIDAVVEILSVAGDHDLIVRLLVDDVQQLHRVVTAFRKDPRVAGTRTTVVLGAWVREARPGA